MPREEDNFSEDRYYVDEIDRVFVRFDPYPDYLRIIFPAISEIEFKIKYDVMEELAKREPTLVELISACYNVEAVADKPTYGFIPLSSDGDPEIYVCMKPLPHHVP
ncbi:MAG: hypothetical protein IKI57_00820 [Clostridia bacterium]|nr:hypothetical protein [Clostridia bacterium]